MCTALLYKAKNSCFGRTLDVETEYGEEIIVIPKDFSLRSGDKTKYRIISVGKNVAGYPLLFDGMNEKGLSIAGLNFKGNAKYFDKSHDKYNIPSYDFILSVLGKCESVVDTEEFLEKANITNDDFSDTLKSSPLHWMIADRNSSIVIEQTADGLKIYKNYANVLTNNPPFPYQMQNLNNYINLTALPPESTKLGDIPLDVYSRGMGALGLPGDVSSISRFVRCVFNSQFAKKYENKDDNIRTFFDILDSVKQIRGTVILNDGRKEFTKYTSCYDLDNRTGYFVSEKSNRIMMIDINKFDCFTNIPFYDKADYYEIKKS